MIPFIPKKKTIKQITIVDTKEKETTMSIEFQKRWNISAYRTMAELRSCR